MPSIKNRFARVSAVLAADVANAGTFDIAYPTGTTQTSFTNDRVAAAGHYALVNYNDRWTSAASKISLSFGASVITVTNSSAVTWAAGSTVELFIDQQDGNGIVELVFPVDLVNITTTQDVVTDYEPCIDGTIEHISFVVNKPVTTASKLASLNVEIGTTNLTGGVVALTSALATPMGKIIEGSAITGNNTLTKDSKISIEAASVTAFSEGTGSIRIRIRKTISDIQ